MQQLEELVDDADIEKQMLTRRCADLDRKAMSLVRALECIDEQAPGGHGAALAQVVAEADAEKQKLGERITALEAELAQVSHGLVDSEAELQAQLSTAEAGMQEWAQYAASIEVENERLRTTVSRLEEAEAQRILEKGGSTPRERNPDMARPARPGEGEADGDDLMQRLHAKNVARERARARVEQLAGQLSTQLEVVTREKQGLTVRCQELEAQVEALHTVVSNVEVACRQAVERAQRQHGAQEHWRTASDLSIALQQVLASIAASQRSMYMPGAGFAAMGALHLGIGGAFPMTTPAPVVAGPRTASHTVQSNAMESALKEAEDHAPVTVARFESADSNHDGVVDQAEWSQWAHQANSSMGP